MADWAVETMKISEVKEHPNADRLVIYKFEGNDLTVVAAKDTAQAVDTEMLFFPEHSIIPEWILKEFGFWNEEKDRGFLAGPNYDVVKPTKLRGVLSDGIALPADSLRKSDAKVEWDTKCQDLEIDEWQKLDHSWVAVLGITKYEAPLPANNEVEKKGAIAKWDVENYKKYGKYLSAGEQVVITEKYHGSCAIYRLARNPETGEPEFSIGSKNQAKNGLWFKADAENWYTRANNKYAIEWNMKRMLENYPFAEEIIVMGEVYGSGVQKGWTYDQEPGDIGFRAFELQIGGGNYSKGGYIVDLGLLESFNIPTVEVVGNGKFDSKWIGDIANLEWTGTFKREGVVVRPAVTRINEATGLPLAIKFISNEYLAYNSKRPIQEDVS